MLITILFLISCVITARVLEKKRMHVASIAYTVMFVILFVALLLTIDLPLISRAFSNIMGAKAYQQTRDALVYALHSAGYGCFVLVALFLTFFVQIALAVICAVVTVVKFFKNADLAHLFKKDYNRRPYTSRALYLQKDINLLCCRMLN